MRKPLVTLLFLLLATFARAIDVETWTHSMFTLPSVDGWSKTTVNHPNGAWLIRLSPAKPSIEFTLDLGETFAARSNYSFFFKGSTRNFDAAGSQTNVAPTFKFGPSGVEFTNSFSPLGNPSLLRVTNCVAPFAFSNITIRFTAVVTNVQDFYWEGFALSPDSGVDAFGDAFYTFVPPTVTNNVVRKGNLIRNSSFETGWQWWMHARKTPINSNELYSVYLDEAYWRTNSNGAKSGTAAAYITEGRGARFAIYLSPIRVSRDLKPYTLSFWQKGQRPLTVAITNLVGTPAGRSNANFTWTFATPATTNWTRYSTSFVYAGFPSREIEITMSAVMTPTNYISVDDVQLEEGGLTNWEPAEVVEMGLETGRFGNLFVGSEAPVVRAVLYNASGSNVPCRVVSSVVDSDNITVSESTNLYLAPPGLSTNEVTTVAPKFGWFRLIARDELHPMSEGEIQFIRTPSVNPNPGTNTFIGIHNNAYVRHGLTNLQIGFRHNRSYSPGAFPRWNIIEVSTNTFDWNPADYLYNQLIGAGQQVLSTLWGGGFIPSWYSMAGANPSTNALARYITNTVSRYKAGVSFWETRNEPSTLVYTNAAQYAAILDVEVASIKQADSNAFVVGFGGASELVFMSNVWTALQPTTKSNIGAVSVHLYPLGQNVMMGTTLDADTRFRDLSFMVRESWGKPIWNTETGMYDYGALGGPALGYITDSVQLYGSLDDEPISRSKNQARNLIQILRGLGHGFARHYHYDARLSGYRLGATPSAEPSLTEADESYRPSMAQVLWCKALLDPHEGSFWITNQAGVEVYGFRRGSNSIAAMFTQAKTNGTLTLTNSGFGVFDRFGNVIQTNVAAVRVNRNPVYVVSSSMTTNALAAAIVGGSLVWTNAIDNPVASVDISPFGTHPQTNQFVFRWNAVSPTIGNSPSFPSNVVTRAFVDGLFTNWTSWSERRVMTVDNIPPGKFRLRVQARDARSDATNETLGPFFSVQPDSVTRSANSATVQRLTIP